MKDINNIIGAKFKALRENRSLPQYFLAALLNMNDHEYRQFEEGDIDISCSQLFEVAKYLSIPIEQFFIGAKFFLWAANNPRMNKLEDVLSKSEAIIAGNKVLLREKDEEIAMLQAKLIWFYDQTASNEGNAPGGDQ